jgi:hypothetical protein
MRTTTVLMIAEIETRTRFRDGNIYAVGSEMAVIYGERQFANILAEANRELGKP